jgi:hypothetical protein
MIVRPCTNRKCKMRWCSIMYGMQIFTVVQQKWWATQSCHLCIFFPVCVYIVWNSQLGSYHGTCHMRGAGWWSWTGVIFVKHKFCTSLVPMLRSYL